MRGVDCADVFLVVALVVFVGEAFRVFEFFFAAVRSCRYSYPVLSSV